MQRLQQPFCFYSVVFILGILLGPRLAMAACPDLRAYYPAADVNWPALSQRLAPLLEECLQSSEFFALYGAAQLNSGNVAEASESLERALLLEPDNGAALIDYAQALYLQGQLFSALQLNEAVLQRENLPADIEAVMLARQQAWRALTSERSVQLDLLAGYDTNLNGAPDASQITLTLSGLPILLDLNEEFRPQNGPYANFRLGGRYRKLAPQHQHNWQADLRGRISEDTDSDLLQLGGRYSFIRPSRSHSWQLDAGLNHLQFGGNSLYTATDMRARYQPANNYRCKPYYGVAVQQQLFTGQRQLDALESKASAGINCPIAGSRGNQLLTTEFSLLANTALDSGRLGGDRDGWQLNLDWQISLPIGELRSQLSHTQLQDSDGYTALLQNNAKRWLRRSYLLLQYRRVLREDLTLLVNFYHQDQNSNLQLFKSTDTTFEIGFSLSL
ncbi:MAG: tetratricopeptide repeat protein [Pseudohongiellaceae bacterium]